MAKLNENDKELVQEMSKIENDDTLMQFTKAQLQELWKTVADQSAIRSVQELRKTAADQLIGYRICAFNLLKTAGAYM